MSLIALRVRRFVNRAALKAHENRINAILSGLSESELAEARMTVAELNAIIERHERRRAEMRRAGEWQRL